MRKFAWVLMLFAGGVMLLILYVKSQNQQRKQSPAQTSDTTTLPISSPSTPAPPDKDRAPKESASKPPEPGTRKQDAPDDSEWTYMPYKPTTVTIGSLEDQSKYLFELELSSRGGGVNSLRLTRYFMTVEDKRLAHKDPQGYELACGENPDKYKGHYKLLRPIGDGKTLHSPYTTRKLQFRPAGAQKWETVSLDGENWKLEPPGVESLPDGTQRVRFTWTLDRNANYGTEKQAEWKGFIRIIKTYEVRPDDYSVALSLEVENLSPSPVDVVIDQSGPVGVVREGYRMDNRYVAYGKLRGEDQAVQVSSKAQKKISKMTPGDREHLGKSDDGEPMLWVGQVNQYFGSLMYLVPPSQDSNSLASPQHKATFYVSAFEDSSSQRSFLTGVTLPVTDLKGQGKSKVSFDVFTGPKDRTLFQDQKLYNNLNYLSTLDLGSCFCAWQPLTMGMMWLLEKLSLVSFGNYGVAIILLVILVRMALHPVTKRSQMSMMKMQKLAPQMQKLKEKYPDDKNAYNREVMQLYKHGGATPLLGCLPMLLQMPIWIALFTSIRATIALRHAAFLPVWITDLASPDALFTWTNPLPLIGNTFNFLPILVTIAMFLQTKLNPQMGQTPSPDQQKQQQMMKYMMPLMMLFFFYKTPSGLNLYIMASTFAGVAEQKIIRRHIRQREEEEAAVVTSVNVPGKGPRSSRPKKPKGPFWVKGR